MKRGPREKISKFERRISEGRTSARTLVIPDFSAIAFAVLGLSSVIMAVSRFFWRDWSNYCSEIKSDSVQEAVEDLSEFLSEKLKRNIENF